MKQINHLMAHGRIIVLQVSQSDEGFLCPALSIPQEKYKVLFNYACLQRSKAAHLLTSIQVDPQVQW